MQRKTKYIIVGGGVAGTVLGLNTYFRNIPFVLLDDGDKNNSSRVSAGLFNPIVFKRLTKSWNIDLLFPEVKKFFSGAEKLFGKSFLFDKNYLRILSNEEEKNLFLEKSKEDSMKKYLSEEIIHDFFSDIINSKSGIARVKGTGCVDLDIFLDSARDFFISKNMFIKEEFDFDNLNISQNIGYKNISAEKIIFAQGFRNNENPYFSWLPFKLVKGEILTLRIDNFQTNDIISKNIFIVPLGNNLFKVGATHNWDNIDCIPTDEGKKYLCEKLDDILKVPYQIIDHKASVRPSTRDRRPYLGTHPEYQNIHVFNGFGAKGVIMSPYLSSHLLDFLENDLPLDSEVNISRYLKYYN
jgi:glycine oxidase